MNNYVRALRLALRYRGTIIGIFVSSLLVGLLWGANITAVYPFVQVVFRGQSMHDWVDEKIDAAQVSACQLEASLRQLQSPGGKVDGQPPNLEIQFQQSRLSAEWQALQGYLWLEPEISL